jgi:tetratricopeptide (TPR) repeat protein
MAQSSISRADALLLNGRRPWLWLLLIIAILYLPSLGYDFQFMDDNYLIKDNMHRLRDFSFVFRAFGEGAFHGSSGVELFYRPLLMISYMFDALLGSSPLFFHIGNTVLHVISTWLLFLVLLQMNYSRRIAWLFSVIFAVHPVNLHAIAWLPGRNDELLAIFVFAGFLYFLRYVESLNKRYYVLACILYLLALFTKESAIVLPVICLIYLVLQEKRKFEFRELCLVGGSFFLLTVPWWFVRSSVISEKVKGEELFQSLTTNFPGLLVYLGKIMFPFNLSTLPSLGDSPIVYGMVATALLVGLYAVFRMSDRKLGLFGLCWYVMLILPSLARPLTSLTDFSEHRAYAAVPGVFFMILSVRIDWPKSLHLHEEKVAYIVAIPVTVMLVIINVLHAPVYKNRITFWENAVEKSPTASFNRNNLGSNYYREGQREKAIQEWEKALELNPNEPLVHSNLGMAFAEQGRLDVAEKHFLTELKSNPNFDKGYFNLGTLYFKEGKKDEAVANWAKAVDLNPENVQAHFRLALHFMDKGDRNTAILHANEVIRITGSVPQQLLPLADGQK